jgi:hypothetical protein
MSKIICSLEEWDSIIDYYRPNGSSKTWYLKELKELNRPLMWGMWNIFSEDVELFDNGRFRGIITPNYSRNIEYTAIENIDNQPHIYIINVWNLHFFVENFDIGFTCMSQKYIEDVRNGKCKIVLIYLFEGYTGSHGNHDLEILEKWRKDMNFPVNSIYLICGNLISDQIVRDRGLGYQARPTHSFEPWNRYDETTPIDFKPIDNRYLFLSYNRNPRPQRLVFLTHLLEYGIFDKGLISLNKLREPIPDYLNQDHLNYLKDNAPFIIDHRYDLDYNLAVNITKEDYERTFLSMVTESLVDDGTLFFSEKIWKPLMVGHPFLLYGNQYSLKYLKEKGYRTFDKWFDESYDNEPSRDQRSIMISKELKRLSELSMDELHQMRNEMKEVCQHNQLKYRELYDLKYSDMEINKDISDVLEEIWSDLNKN